MKISKIAFLIISSIFLSLSCGKKEEESQKSKKPSLDFDGDQIANHLDNKPFFANLETHLEIQNNYLDEIKPQVLNFLAHNFRNKNFNNNFQDKFFSKLKDKKLLNDLKNKTYQVVLMTKKETSIHFISQNLKINEALTRLNLHQYQIDELEQRSSAIFHAPLNRILPSEDAWAMINHNSKDMNNRISKFKMIYIVQFSKQDLINNYKNEKTNEYKLQDSSLIEPIDKANRIKIDFKGDLYYKKMLIDTTEDAIISLNSSRTKQCFYNTSSYTTENVFINNQNFSKYFDVFIDNKKKNLNSNLIIEIKPNAKEFKLKLKDKYNKMVQVGTYPNKRNGCPKSFLGKDGLVQLKATKEKVFETLESELRIQKSYQLQ